MLGYGLVYAAQAVFAVTGLLHIPTEVSNIFALFVGGMAAMMEKAWKITERAAAYGVELPQNTNTGSLVQPTSPTHNDTTEELLK